MGEKSSNNAGRFVGLGFQFVAPILIMVFLGQAADRRFGTDPWGVMGGAFTGFAVGFVSIYRSVMRAQRDDERGAGPRNGSGPGNAR